MAPTASSTRSIAQGSCLYPADAWAHLRTVLRLSDRELLVAQGIFAEHDTNGIAQETGIPSDLVYRTTQRIYIKLHIGSRLELISRIKSEYRALVAEHFNSEHFSSEQAATRSLPPGE
jgi:hypothetical protein